MILVDKGNLSGDDVDELVALLNANIKVNWKKNNMSHKWIKESKQKPKVSENEGIHLYNTFGWVFILCGIASFLLMFFVSLMPQDYEKYNIPLAFGIWTAISVTFIILGIIPLVLGKYSKRFQIWAGNRK